MHHASAVVGIVTGTCLLLLCAILILALTKRLRMPFTVMLVLAGMLIASLAIHNEHLTTLVKALVLSPDLILYVFLPTLVFESAFNMDSRLLRHNLAPVLGLAGPGLLLSTGIIGLIVGACTPIPYAAAFLLGAILSATDPVSVVALFRHLGAPRRLTVLVEGESLFNDATAIVVSRILLGVVTAGVVSTQTLTAGMVSFVVVFLGGLAVGWGLGLLVGMILGWVEADPSIEITLTTALAYLSFLIAEEVLHVSGVMATMGAGLVMGGWGRHKISPSVRTYLEHFWEYMAFVANALIFILVGLRVDLAGLIGTADLLVWVIAAMLVSRAVVVYGLVPALRLLPGVEPVNLRYQTVMYWGGLRGAIALAIALSLPHLEATKPFVPLVMGAVLFTLLAQGLTIEPVVRRLGLDQPPLPDRFAFLNGDLTAKQTALRRLPGLLSGGLFSGSIAERLRQECREEIDLLHQRLHALRVAEIGHDEELRLLYLWSLSEEKAHMVDMFHKGHLTEPAMRELVTQLDLQADAVRYGEGFRTMRTHQGKQNRVELWLARWLDRLPGLAPVGEQLRMLRIARDYQIAWGRYQGSGRILELLQTERPFDALPEDSIAEVCGVYEHWHDHARERLDTMAEQFPEFVQAMQQRAGRRLVCLAEAESLEEQVTNAMLPRGIAEPMLHDISCQLRALREQDIEKLRVSPEELLRKVPFFADVPEEEFADIATRMRAHSFATGEPVIQQGETDDSLYLIARGVVRVSREDNGASKDLATLLAGDFFGEMALLHGEPRTATVRAVTPSSLYELRRDQLKDVMERFPGIRTALEAADRKRKRELDALQNGQKTEE